MIEILVLWQLTKRIGNIVEQKGRKSGWYKVLTVVLWFGGEIVGAVLGAILTAGSESAQCALYLLALGGAATGGGVAYLIANSLSPTSSAPLSAPPGMNSTSPSAPPGMNSASLPVPPDIRSIGIAVSILGLLLTCCLCPLASNYLLLIASNTGDRSSLFSLYGKLFPSGVGYLALGTYVAAAQLALSTILALLVLIAGIVILVRIRRASLEQE